MRSCTRLSCLQTVPATMPYTHALLCHICASLPRRLRTPTHCFVAFACSQHDKQAPSHTGLSYLQIASATNPCTLAHICHMRSQIHRSEHCRPTHLGERCMLGCCAGPYIAPGSVFCRCERPLRRQALLRSGVFLIFLPSVHRELIDNGSVRNLNA